MSAEPPTGDPGDRGLRLPKDDPTAIALIDAIHAGDVESLRARGARDLAAATGRNELGVVVPKGACWRLALALRRDHSLV